MEGGDAGMNGIAGKEKGLIIKGKGKEIKGAQGLKKRTWGRFFSLGQPLRDYLPM